MAGNSQHFSQYTKTDRVYDIFLTPIISTAEKCQLCPPWATNVWFRYDREKDLHLTPTWFEYKIPFENGSKYFYLLRWHAFVNGNEQFSIQKWFGVIKEIFNTKQPQVQYVSKFSKWVFKKIS